MTTVTYMRDVVVLNEALRIQLKLAALVPGDTLQIIGRHVRHDAGYTLRLTGCTVMIVASSYDANGGSVNVSGTPGLAGGAGTSGRTDPAPLDGGGAGDGQPGGRGAGGGPGGPAGSVSLLCENLVNAGLLANGGAGGAGGAGGGGGQGGQGRRPIGTKTDGLDPGSGGPGGDGGNGGNSSSGGWVRANYVSGTAPQCQTAGSNGGAAGPAGQGGQNGGYGLSHGLGSAPSGAGGTAGAAGPAGTTTVSTVTQAEYWQLVAAELGATLTAGWAAYRDRVGEYLYRAEAAPAGSPDQPTNLQLAVREFGSVLALAPGDPLATQFTAQIQNGQDVLGFRRDLDIVPNFQLFSQSYAQWTNLALGSYGQGVANLLAASNRADFGTFLAEHKRELGDARDIATADQQTALAVQAQCQIEVGLAQQHLNTATAAMAAAHNAMANKSIDIAGIVGAVVDVAVAVAAVVAALPTGGTSLIALVPALASLTTVVIHDAPAIVQELFKQEDVDVKAVQSAYKTVAQDVSNVIAAGKAVINVVSLISKLEAGTTPDNGPSAALVMQSIDAAHALLLAQMRSGQSGLAVLTAGLRIDRAQQAQDQATAALASATFDVSLAVKTGLAAIDAAGVARDSLLTQAVYAQRAVEIYTLKDEAGVVQLDSGYLSPDQLQDFAESGPPTATGIATLIEDLNQSWSKFLNPIRLQTDYLSYFADPALQLSMGLHTLTFNDPAVIATFIADPVLDFVIRLTDLPEKHFHAKVSGVAVAFIGATSASGVSSCEVRHGYRYVQLSPPDGSTVTQLLRPRTATVACPHTALELAGVSAAPAGDPLTAPAGLSLWGRGVAGFWTVSLTTEQPTDLTKLTSLQVWISYQFQSAIN